MFQAQGADKLGRRLSYEGLEFPPQHAAFDTDIRTELVHGVFRVAHVLFHTFHGTFKQLFVNRRDGDVFRLNLKLLAEAFAPFPFLFKKLADAAGQHVNVERLGNE